MDLNIPFSFSDRMNLNIFLSDCVDLNIPFSNCVDLNIPFSNCVDLNISFSECVELNISFSDCGPELKERCRSYMCKRLLSVIIYGERLLSVSLLHTHPDKHLGSTILSTANRGWSGELLLGVEYQVVVVVAGHGEGPAVLTGELSAL